MDLDRDHQRLLLISVLDKIKETKEMDSEMNSGIKDQIEQANKIFDEGDHYAKQVQKARHPVEFVLHSTSCKTCFKVLVRNGGLLTIDDFYDWTHESKDVQCEKFGHSKWMMQNMFILN